SIDKALSDPRVLKVLMPALGLPDQVSNPGLVKRALLSDPKDPKGVAAQLGTTWKNAAATLNLKATTTPKTVAFEGLKDVETAAVAGQLRLGEAVMTARSTPPVTPKVRAFDGLADKVTSALLAQLRPGENATTDRATREIEHTAALTAGAIRKAQFPGTDLPAIAKDALQQMASLMQNGSFDSALSVVDQALTFLDGATGIAPEELRRGRVALMEGGIVLDQIRRDAFGVAKRLEKLVGLDAPDNPVWAPAYKTRMDAFQKQGVDNNLNFSLEVAAAMGQRMRDGTKYAIEMDLAKTYIDRAMNVLNTRDGRPTKTPIEGVPITRISQSEATKLLDTMKNTAPPNLPRAQLEVTYSAAAALSAIKLGEAPPAGLPGLARDALKQMASLVRSGSYNSAVQRLDDALLALDQDTVTPASMKRDARIALLEASISLDQVRRNASGVAERVEKLVALDNPQRATWSQAFQTRLENFHKDGINGNVNFALEVSAAMANRMLAQATTLDEQLQVQSLVNRSQQVLNGRDGKALSATAPGAPQPKIPAWEAGKIVDLMKKSSPLGSLSDPKMLDVLTNGFTKYEYRTGLSVANPGMADAVYFSENAKNMKSPYDILGNSVMRRVVLGALGIPDQVAIQPVETQARAITSRLKLTDLQDPVKVRGLAERYLMAQADKAAASGGAGGANPFAMVASLSIKA
ncbi:MAG: DUF1217 domain-containing protein, partial [Alphaproteobacteria bacterium]